MSISPLPSPNVNIFNNEYWSNSNNSSSNFVNYPLAQGTVTFPMDVIVNNDLIVHRNTTIDNNLSLSGSLSFSDITSQTTAFTDLIPNPANTYNNPSQIIVNTKGQITSITSGSSSSPFIPIFITSNNSSVNNWTIDTTSLTKNYYQFYLYATNGLDSFTSSGYVENTSITTPSTIGLLVSGTMVKSPTVFQTANKITYCAGFQQNYNWNKNVYGFQMNKINAFTTDLDFVSTILGVNENEDTCPPSAGNWLGCQIEVSIASGSTDLTAPSTLILACYSLD